MYVEYNKFYYRGCRPHAILVSCEHCGKQFNENAVKATNIEEDELGRDLLTFKCPNCLTMTKSLRRG